MIKTPVQQDKLAYLLVNPICGEHPVNRTS